MKSISFLFLLTLVTATPPACFLSCINEVAHTCPREHIDIYTLCVKRDSVIGCLVDICPYGNFESARDHFLGTCLEHIHDKPSKPDFISSLPPQHTEIIDHSKITLQPTKILQIPAEITVIPNKRLKIVRNSKNSPSENPQVIYDLSHGRSRNAPPPAPGRNIIKESSYLEIERKESAFNSNKKLYRK